jgi:NAD+ kinase
MSDSEVCFSNKHKHTHTHTLLPSANIDEAAAAPASGPLNPTKSNVLPLTPMLGDALLREYAQQLGPLNTSSQSDDNFDNDASEPSLSVATTVGESSPSECASMPSSPSFASRSNINFHSRSHRKNALSVESIPQQTIMKALASARRNQNPNNCCS